jgi:uncharacterized integral membrane protein (TIGR00698 family)
VVVLVRGQRKVIGYSYSLIMNMPLAREWPALQAGFMASALLVDHLAAQVPANTRSLLPGLVVAGLGVAMAAALHGAAGTVPVIVGAVLAGVLFGNTGLLSAQAGPGLAFASQTLLRLGIVLLGLRLSIGDVAELGPATLAVIVATVTGTFFGVQRIGRRLGLSEGLSLLVASGFSICGNSAIASVKGVVDADDEEVAAAVGLVTLCGTLAIVVIPALGSLFGLDDIQLGIWTGAGVQDTAQVIAVASAAGPAVLATATAVKLTRVLFLAPIVAGVSLRNRRRGIAGRAGKRPALLPLFVLGFLATMLIRTTGLLSVEVLDAGRQVEQYLLAAGMVGLGSSVNIGSLGRLGFRPLLLGACAWLCVGCISLAAIFALGLS